MFELLVRRPWFRRLWAAGAISQIGDWLGFVAIARLTLDRGGGPIALALIYAAHVLPHTWVMPIAGILADRFDRRRLLVTVPVLQTLLTAAMALCAARGALGPLQLLVVVRATISTCLLPAETAALRHTVEPSELVRANALMGGTWSVCYVLGMALGGVIAIFGPTIALLLDASSFFLAALLASGLPVMRPPVDAASADHRGISFVLTIPRDLKKAFDHARADRDLFRAMLGKAPVAIGGGAGWILINLVAENAKPLGTAAMSLGILQAVRGAGTGIGPMVVTWFSRGETPSRHVERLAVAMTFVSIIFFSWFVSNPTLLVVAALTWGLGTGTNWVVCSANLQRLAPDAMIGRLASIDELWTTGALVFGAVGAGVLLEYGAPMLQTAAIATSVGTLLFVWLDQREATAPKELRLTP